MRHTLVVMRHAKSDWSTAQADYARPLNERGRRDALAAGRQLADQPIDLVLCSSAIRTRQTWERAADGGASAARVTYHDEIYGAQVPELLALLRTLEPTTATVLLIGHFPSVAELVEDLGRRDDNPGWAKMAVKFPTSAMALLEFDGDWSELDASMATLIDYQVPRG